MKNDSYSTSLDDVTLKYAAEVLKDDFSTRETHINEIREWLNTQPQLHGKTDGVTIVRFLRGCKFDIEKTKKKLKSYYQLRGSTPEWFSDRDPTLPALQELLSLGVFLPLLKKDPAGRLVIIIRVAAHDPSHHKQDDVFKVGKMILDLAIEQDESVSVYGVCAIFDLTSVSLGHARQLTPAMIKRAVHAWQDCYPVRTKSLDFINSPSYVNVILRIFKGFMREKMRNRVHVHGYDLQSLHQVVPPSVLPQEYGGSSGTVQDLIDHWKVKLTESKDWFADDEKYKAEPSS
ncbi:retinol-binding protein pinta-like [Macrosteles quadrilineatus]|uniref:retinol-binding protein pinta-like n=1 Tax=Macrosteles quadrilineatus TaxID=74068 RepID=UPI0023E15EFC|nr:retinol-binding protein pinta-like [Macrosteles quadrilineatus]XP_054258514.1 retinol-binding protein pinta-like [Macrosteles quadrilineatus]